MNNIEDKILTLVKMKNPIDPMEYVQGVVKEYTLDKIRKDIISCEKCDICKFKTKSIGRGNINSRILVINEGISEEQFALNNTIAMPLMDTDGETLSRALSVINANEKELYIVNAMSCFSGKNDGGKIKKRIPSVSERTACKQYLDRIIKAVNPYVIITLGSVASNSLNGDRISIVKDRGNMFEYNGYPVMPTFHPGFFREMANKFDEEMMNMYKDDFLLDLYNAFLIAKEKDANCKIGDIKLPF